MVNYLVEPYVTDDFITGMNAEILFFTQPSNIKPKKYGEALWNKELCCNCVYDEHMFKRIFIEGIHGSIRHSMCSYGSSKISATLHNLARYTMS